jgi:hypothetical protein
VPVLDQRHDLQETNEDLILIQLRNVCVQLFHSLVELRLGHGVKEGFVLEAHLRGQEVEIFAPFLWGKLVVWLVCCGGLHTRKRQGCKEQTC